MPYSFAFFSLQLTFAEQLAAKFDLPLVDCLHDYTTFTKSLGSGEEWQAYARGLHQCAGSRERAEWTYQWYLPRQTADPDPPADTHFHGHPLFGCFYYELREGGRIVRPHLIKTAQTSREGVLASSQVAKRRQELTALFTHLRATVPQAQSVLGNSWLYNLEAYRRLFPPEYTAFLPESEGDEFQFLSRWGQFFDHRWQVKESLSRLLLERLNVLEVRANVRSCFPYPIVQPRGSLSHFYEFYGIAGAK